MKTFIPPDFQPPTEVRIGAYVLRPLTEQYVELDLAAVNSSIDLIRRIRGGTWPRGVITLDEDRADLIQHREEFEQRTSFAYAILSADEKTCAGSVYVFPPNHPFDENDKSGMSPDAEAVVSYWVSQAAYDAGFHPELRAFVAEWARNDWPFAKVHIVDLL